MSHRTRPELKAQLKAKGITQDQVAAAHGVGRTMVTHWLAGRNKSEPLLRTIERLLAEKTTRGRRRMTIPKEDTP